MRNAPGRVRDAIVDILSKSPKPLAVGEIAERVSGLIGPTPDSSVRSYLRLNTPARFAREARGLYRIRAVSSGDMQLETSSDETLGEPFRFGKAQTLLRRLL